MKSFQKLQFILLMCAIILGAMAQGQTQIGSDIDGEAADDLNGNAVSLSGDGSRIATGAYLNDGNGSNAGYVRIHEWSGSTWVQVGADIIGEAPDDWSGYSVSLSFDGSRVAVGAIRNDDNGANSGQVRLYDWTGSAWVQVGTDIDGEAAIDESGYAVSLSSDGSRVAIGAIGNNSSAGHVRIYEWNSSAWIQVGTDIDGEAAGDESGYSVSLSSDGSRVAIGARFNTGNTGHVRIYDWSGSAWLQVGIDIDGEAPGDWSGYSVSLSADGSRIAIGAVWNNSSAGHVRLYDWSGTAWVQVGADIEGEAAGDWSGHSVSLSGDGSRVAIGAINNNGSTGHVRLYSWNSNAWVQYGTDIDGEAAGDQSGYSVSLSADGSHVAVGAPFNDGIGSDAGHVRVYSLCTPATCDDGNPCTSDICDPVFGCLHLPLLDTDGDGLCDAEDDCPTNSLFHEIGAPCDDGIPCTENDVVTAACECHGTPNDNLCDDNNVCNGTETCDINLGCLAGTPLICDDGSACTTDTCDPILGCQFTPLNCDDGDPCTIDTCDPVLFCIHTPVPDTDGDAFCDAEDDCPTNSLFHEIGAPCDDGIPCTENDVVTAACECHGTPNDNLCDDNNVCNGTETCNINLGCLSGTPLICDDGNACTTDTCDPILGCQFVVFCGPPNNECGNAQNLSVPTFPATSNVNGTLFGASNSGGVACSASAAGGDVFYAFTLAQENHVGITVNPFAGADVVVEVLDGCAGTTIACINNMGAGGIENQLLQNLPSGAYTIRVHNAVGSPEPEASSYFLINVQQMPYAQVQDNPNSTLYACNQIGFQLDDFVGASPQTTPWVFDYAWLAAEVGGGSQTFYQRGYANYVARISWLGLGYSKTYNVFVRLLINHPVYGPTWGVYQGNYQNPNLPGASACTIATASNVTPTELLPNYTPTNAGGDDYALCDFAIAYNVQGSENFRWRFDPDLDPNNSNEIIYTRGSGNPSVRLSWVNNLIPGLTYTVAVEVQVAGQWSGYSTVLPLTLALTPNDIEVRSQFCGGTYAPNGYILSESVCDADLYQFRFTPTGGGTPSYRNSGNYVCFLSGANPALAPGDYDVQVKVTQNGVPGDWGPACTITISGPQGQVNETPAQRDIEATRSAMLFPNPNAGNEVRVNLDGLNAGNHKVMITVYDIHGKQISTQGFGHEGTSLSRLIRFDRELAMGMYLVQIVVDGENYASEKLVVK